MKTIYVNPDSEYELRITIRNNDKEGPITIWEIWDKIEIRCIDIYCSEIDALINGLLDAKREWINEYR